MRKRLAIAIGLMAVFSCVIGCSSQSSIPLCPSTKDSIHVKYEVKFDSIFVDRWHTIKESGDTIFVHDSIFVEKWREHHTSDTIMMRDSIPYPVEVVKEVRKRNGYDVFTARGFWAYTAIVVLLIIIAIVRWYIKSRLRR